MSRVDLCKVFVDCDVHCSVLWCVGGAVVLECDGGVDASCKVSSAPHCSYLYPWASPGVLTHSWCPRHAYVVWAVCLLAVQAVAYIFWPPCLGDRHGSLMIIYSDLLFLTATCITCVYLSFDVLQVSREEEKRRKERNQLSLRNCSFNSFYIFCNLLFI
jgi:hypothetical protein